MAAQAAHFAPKAKRVIYLHMVGGPSQMDLFDHKPEMMKWYDKDLPPSVQGGQRWNPGFPCCRAKGGW